MEQAKFSLNAITVKKQLGHCATHRVLLATIVMDLTVMNSASPVGTTTVYIVVWQVSLLNNSHQLYQLPPLKPLPHYLCSEYGRGAGYPWKFGDWLNDDGMIWRCENDHGPGNCEKWGAVYYPKCQGGYHAFGCCLCRPNSFTCSDMGYVTNHQVDLSCAKHLKIGDPTSLSCKSGLVQDGGLCYPACNYGFYGAGPVCWQSCGGSETDCGAGCANSPHSCGLAVFEMTISTLIVAANIVTLGIAAPVTGTIDAAIDTVTIAGKAYRFNSIVGKGMLKAAKFLATTGAAGLKYTTRLVNTRWGSFISRTASKGRYYGIVYASLQIAKMQFANEFINMTSENIAAEIDTLGPTNAKIVKERWAEIQIKEMAENLGWLIADVILTAVGFFDISGVTDLVNAYTKPICDTNFPFPMPTIAQSMSTLLLPTNLQSTIALSKPELWLSPKDVTCEDVSVAANVYSNCTGVVSAYEISQNFIDDSGASDLVFFIDNEKDMKKLHASADFYSVTLTAVDSFNSKATCTANVWVTDKTEATVTCPTVHPINNTIGRCGATVTFEGASIVDNCLAVSTATLVRGYPSGSVFPVGNTHMEYQITSSQNCSFTVIVNDIEAPFISCDGLAKTLPTDPGLCTRYVYPWNIQSPSPST